MDFAAGEPSGGLLQNYVVIDTNRKVFYDLEGDVKRCLLCKTRKDTKYTLRGKCEDSLLGTIFSLISKVQVYHLKCLDTTLYALMSEGYLTFKSLTTVIR